MCEKCTEKRHGALSRRGFVTGVAGLATATLAAPHLAFAQQTDAPQNAISPDQAIDLMREGNARYAAKTPTVHDYSADRASRALGQYPVAAVLSCSDSRVAPELLFDQGPGDLFVVRVAGNVVNDEGLASLEYGVSVLGTPLIMVLGHSSCGAVEAAIKVVKDNVVLPGHLPDLMNTIRPAVVSAKRNDPKDMLNDAIKENVRFAMNDIKHGSAIIAGAMKSGKVRVVGGVYEISTGKVTKI